MTTENDALVKRLREMLADAGLLSKDGTYAQGATRDFEAVFDRLSAQGEAPCLCDRCTKPVTYDLIVPDEVWHRIAPNPVEGWKGGGVLCPECIVAALSAQGEPVAWTAA